MISLKCLLLMASCLILATAAPLSLDLVDFSEPHEFVVAEYDDGAFGTRHIRSPQGGSLDLSYTQDQSGREAAAQYNQNLFTSSDGSTTVDAYGQASRNFDQNRNDYGVGIQLKGTF